MKKQKTKIKQTYGVTKQEITSKLGHSGWLKFPQTVQQELEDKYLQMKNLGLI